jgi:glyoxylase-like metal-dependent hydrolase (beta-lactamase superfamily II)
MPEVLPGLWQLNVPIVNSPIGYVMPYLMEVPGGYAIIDPGWDEDESISSLRSQLAELGLGFGDLKQVIVTHMHRDHYGMAPTIREESGAELVVHERELEFIRWRQQVTGSVEAWYASHGIPDEEAAQFGQVGRTPPRYLAENGEPDRTMVDDEMLKLGRFHFRVLWTPGHTPGHACFYEADQEALLTGDHVLPRISPNVSLWPYSDQDPLGDYIRSLRRLRGLSVKQVLPAHKYSFEDLTARLDELEEHHVIRSNEIIDAVRDGADNAYEMARRLTWSIGRFDDFPSGTRRAALGETFAHLRYLVIEGRLEAHETDGKVRYSIKSG